MDKPQSTELFFELSHPGRRTHRLPPCDVPVGDVEELLPAGSLAEEPPPLPEVGEIDLVRHFTNLSGRNMSIDTNFYPLGSCTMKYNPKRHERLASLSGLVALHPLQSESSSQGMLELLWELQNILAEIAGLDAVALQPAAGAHGELTALLVAEAYFRDRGEERTRVLIPDSAHGTNPASAAIAGFDTVSVKSNARGLVDLDDLRAKLDERTAVFMITNPNTLGLFDVQIKAITDVLHARGALVYLDGANMNAILGITRPGDFGVDMMHYNVHKTFTGPHGAGGPGAGPIAVREHLAPYLPAPLVVKSGETFRLDYDRPQTIGRVRSFFGNVGILVRGYCYIRTLGPQGLREVSENAVLNANYLLARVKDAYEVPYGDRCMHEFVASVRTLRRERKISAMDIGKRLLDFGYHAPTVYFPLVVPEALMIEPTETESKETLDGFAEALLRIREEDAEFVRQAPHNLGINRPDEVRAAKEPILRWVRVTCRLLPFAVADGAHNMAADEVLLESAVTGVASLRFYGWAEATLSLGYFQSEQLRRSEERLAILPYVRRPSGGAILIHHHELTYALALPAGPPWQARQEKSATWLCRMHGIIADALQTLGVPVRVVRCEDKQPLHGILCFQHLTAGDLTLGASKVVGSAQRRQRGALLQHGAVLLAASPHAPILPGIVELAGRYVRAAEVSAAVRAAFTRQTGWALAEGDWSAAERERIHELVALKYGQAAWNEKR